MSGTPVNPSNAGAVQLSWTECLLNGELEVALSNYLRFDPEERVVKEVLEDLHDVISLMKTKSYKRAKRAQARIEHRPDWFEGSDFKTSFSALHEASAALDE